MKMRIVLKEIDDSIGGKQVIESSLFSLGYAVSTHTEKAGATSLGIIWKTSKFKIAF